MTTWHYVFLSGRADSPLRPFLERPQKQPTDSSSAATQKKMRQFVAKCVKILPCWTLLDTHYTVSLSLIDSELSHRKFCVHTSCFFLFFLENTAMNSRDASVHACRLCTICRGLRQYLTRAQTRFYSLKHSAKPLAAQPLRAMTKEDDVGKEGQIGKERRDMKWIRWGEMKGRWEKALGFISNGPPSGEKDKRNTYSKRRTRIN